MHLSYFILNWFDFYEKDITNLTTIIFKIWYINIKLILFYYCPNWFKLYSIHFKKYIISYNSYYYKKIRSYYYKDIIKKFLMVYKSNTIKSND